MIEFQNVSKAYRRTADRQQILALDSINFSIAKGEFVSIVGPSGAGKSTLVKLLIALEQPDSGCVLIADRDISNLSSRELPYYRRKIGVVFQDFKLLPNKTVRENVAFALEVSDVHGQDIAKRVPKILTMVGLLDKGNSYPHELSGGEKQRAAIARAMVNLPKILIADEPTGNLDPVATREIIDLLLSINQNGTTTILATHDQTIVDNLARRVIALDHGRVIADQKVGKYIFNTAEEIIGESV